MSQICERFQVDDKVSQTETESGIACKLIQNFLYLICFTKLFNHCKEKSRRNFWIRFSEAKRFRMVEGPN